MSLRPSIEIILTAVPAPASFPDSAEKIAVSSATRRIAFAYERFRNTLEPDEEDILRRKAIYRILQRRLDEDRPPNVTALALLQELIRAHYVQPLPTGFTKVIAEKLVRAQVIRERLDANVADWFLRIMAVAIDRDLYPRVQEEALVQALYHDVAGRVVWGDATVEEPARATQLYMACHRALFAADDDEITYHYFKYRFSEWSGPDFTPEKLQQLTSRLPAFYRDFTPQLYHPLRDRLTRIIRPTAVPYRIVRDLVHDRPEVLKQSPVDREAAIRATLQKRMQRIRERMGHRVWHSILFLFLTKTLIGLIIELPYEIIFLGRAHWLALGVNIAFHPLLLFILAISARLPGQRNSDRVVEQVEKIITGEGEMPTVVIDQTRSYGALTWSFFALVYAVLFMAIFWGMFSFLATLNFSLIAMAMFVIFLGLVSFLSIRIRRSVDAIRVIPKREGAISAVVSFLSLPVLEFGRFLAQNISQVNIALFFMDSILEAPFKLLIDVIEEWFSFVRDRREEIT